MKELIKSFFIIVLLAIVVLLILGWFALLTLLVMWIGANVFHIEIPMWVAGITAILISGAIYRSRK